MTYKKIVLLISSMTILLTTGCSTKTTHVVAKYKKNTSGIYTSYSTTNKQNLKKKGKYKVRGGYYTPFTPKVGYVEVGVASWYGKPFHGRKTANGEIYNMNNYTAAHKLFPVNTVVRVTNLKNEKSIVLRINDRGPYGYNRVIDLSKAAAKKIGFYKKGTTKVKVEVLGYAI